MLVSCSGEILCSYLKALDTAPPQRGGVKDYEPDGSLLQKNRLRLVNDERRLALEEEKCRKVCVGVY